MICVYGPGLIDALSAHLFLSSFLVFLFLSLEFCRGLGSFWAWPLLPRLVLPSSFFVSSASFWVRVFLVLSPDAGSASRLIAFCSVGTGADELGLAADWFWEPLAFRWDLRYKYGEVEFPSWGTCTEVWAGLVWSLWFLIGGVTN